MHGFLILLFILIYQFQSKKLNQIDLEKLQDIDKTFISASPNYL